MPLVHTEKLTETEGISDTPPCECLWGILVCGKSSSWRIISNCPGCGDRSVVFVCHRCHEYGLFTGYECTRCDSKRGVDAYL